MCSGFVLYSPLRCARSWMAMRLPSHVTDTLFAVAATVTVRLTYWKGTEYHAPPKATW
jgi:hypothetical protein